ncbi:breast cancer metastasis-suppressor 1 isoform X4 [Chanodichthys erythropterus]|uniref:breast cancer metastasis-suppressor 1 isoform X4 n=1 Tax=Chanodichthys erythropterus TaxID=933992 RepID=UPI00351E244A
MKSLLPHLHIKLGLMKNFVKVMDKTQAAFKFLHGKYLRSSEAKMKRHNGKPTIFLETTRQTTTDFCPLNHGAVSGEHGVYRELCLQVVQHKHECEVQGAKQHLESERTLLFDAMKTELLEKIRRLEEDKQSSEWWNDDEKIKKCKRRSHLIRSDRKKKAALVSGPYIVYMLRDIDILEDWTAIKKAKAALMPLKKKADNRQVSVRCEDGALFYDGERFSKGSSVVLEVNDNSPAQVVITGISAGEVWFKRTDGTKTKIYVSQLQKGKHAIRKA